MYDEHGTNDRKKDLWPKINPFHHNSTVGYYS